MDIKEKLALFLNDEIDKLIDSYESKIENLTNRIDSLRSEMNNLKKENIELKSELEKRSTLDTNLSNQILLKYNDYLKSGINVALIDEWVLSSNLEDSFLLFLSLQKFAIEKNYEMVVYILELLNFKHDALLHKNEDLQGVILDVFERILSIKTKEANDHFEELMFGILNLLMNLIQTDFKSNLITDIIETHFYLMIENILDFNEPGLIVEFLRASYAYGIHLELQNVIYQILDVEWDFLDSSLTSDNFIYLLWFAYLFDSDQQLLSKALVSKKYFEKKCNDLSLYFYLQECKKGINYPSKSEFSSNKKKLLSGTILNEKETQDVLKKAKTQLTSLMKKKDIIGEYKNELLVINSDQLEHYIDKFNLLWKKVSIPLFDNLKNTVIKNINEVVLLSKDRNKAYITEVKYEEILQKYLPNKLKVIKILEPADQTFKWPTTDVNPQKNNNETNEKNLNENSALKLMGYQITGLTRNKRWEILQKAVPKLGLKKVATIIAYNVRLRKGQKDGIVKFHNSITEWQYDLAKLKNTYYRNDFTWPIS